MADRQTAEAVRRILADVSYPGYTFLVGGVDRLHIRGRFEATCADTGATETQLTRRWYISDEASRSEIVQTALKCVLTAIEHEAREAFKYRGRPIFGPHFDVDALHDLCDAHALAVR